MSIESAIESAQEAISMTRATRGTHVYGHAMVSVQDLVVALNALGVIGMSWQEPSSIAAQAVLLPGARKALAEAGLTEPIINLVGASLTMAGYHVRRGA